MVLYFPLSSSLHNSVSKVLFVHLVKLVKFECFTILRVTAVVLCLCLYTDLRFVYKILGKVF